MLNTIKINIEYEHNGSPRQKEIQHDVRDANNPFWVKSVLAFLDLVTGFFGINIEIINVGVFNTRLKEQRFYARPAGKNY